MEISKLDAAKRQIDTAIRLFFKSADPISIHTLTAAGHQVLMDIAKPENIKSFMKDSPWIIGDKKKEYLAIVNEAENFFKHAEKDPSSVLKFKQEQTEFLLLDAVEMYIQLTADMPENMLIYRAWFLVKFTNIISAGTLKAFKELNLEHKIKEYRKLGKIEFYKTMKEAISASDV